MSNDWNDLEARNENYQKPTNSLSARERIKGELKNLMSAHHKRLDAQGLDSWADDLMPLAGEKLYKAIREAKHEERPPTLRRLCEMVRGRPLGTFKSIPELTPSEKIRSDGSAIMSMLWFYHNHPKTCESDLGQVLMGRVMAQTGMTSEQILKLAREKYTQADCNKWMAEQEKRDPVLAHVGR